MIHIAKMTVGNCFWDIIVEYSGLNNKDWEYYMRVYIVHVHAVPT